MIRIDKGGAPGGAREKCAEITQELRDIYAQLEGQYRARTGKGPVAFDKEAIVEELLGPRPTKAQKQRLLGKLGLVKFGEELVEVMNERLLDEQVLHQLQGDWRARFGAYLDGFHAVALEARKVWDAKLSGMSPEARHQLLGVIRPLYQQSVLTSGRPWLSAPAINALELPWFAPQELAGWTFPPALNSMSLDFKVGAVAAHQAQVADFRERCRTSEALRKYTSLAWMCGTPDGLPAEGALWGFAFDFHAGYLKKGKHPPRDMGDADLRAMATAPEPVRGALAYYALSVRLMGDLIDEKMAGAWKTVTRPLIGFKSEIFSSDYYSGHGIKEALLNSHHGKCAFCESKVKYLAHGDVEHFRPKAGYEQGYGFNLDGYFWEAYAWENLYYSCQVCNQIHKGNKFPVLLNDQLVEVRSTATRKVSEERSVLIDPGLEDPRLAVRFNVWTGEAYPYDLLRWFLDTRKGRQDADEFAWSEPKAIPSMQGRYEVKVHPTNKSFVVTGNGHEMFQVVHQAPPVALRGVRTIQILGLNRPELVLQRVSHLRHLRGVFWAFLVEQSESAAARAALDDSRRPSAEFSSLAIDAWETWGREVTRVKAQVSQQQVNPMNVGLAVDAWLAQYTALMRQQPVYADTPDESWEMSDAIMYHVGPHQVNADERGLVYLKGDEELEKSAGWYLGIPEEDHGLKVHFYDEDDDEIEQMTLKQIIDAKQAWRSFNKATSVLVKGPFKQKLGF
ncbi:MULTISPECIES: hypothetical protein [Myxococcus]|uniref:hypothetical protein n=1 Tax=Myxococcus TaxID=32 RepID=UPI0013D3737C|nr:MULTISPECIES: hypothetical protein [Myxococcus]NVJ22014.1 hypothetical protein [Myxococcus sp. AM011]